MTAQDKIREGDLTYAMNLLKYFRLQLKDSNYDGEPSWWWQGALSKPAA